MDAYLLANEQLRILEKVQLLSPIKNLSPDLYRSAISKLLRVKAIGLERVRLQRYWYEHPEYIKYYEAVRPVTLVGC